MKTSILVLVCAAILAAILPAQSLANNEFFQRSTQLKTMAQDSFDAGDYDAAVQYSIQGAVSVVFIQTFDRHLQLNRKNNRRLNEAGITQWC